MRSGLTLVRTETALCIWAACLPALRPFFLNLPIKSLFGSRRSRTGFCRQEDQQLPNNLHLKAKIPNLSTSERVLFAADPEGQIGKTTKIRMSRFEASNDRFSSPWDRQTPGQHRSTSTLKPSNSPPSNPLSATHLQLSSVLGSSPQPSLSRRQSRASSIYTVPRYPLESPPLPSPEPHNSKCSSDPKHVSLDIESVVSNAAGTCYQRQT